MQSMYVSIKRETRYHRRGVSHTLIAVICVIIFVFVSLFMRNSFDHRREDLIERLRQEREVIAQNENLKVELSSITRGRYLELGARERLGLKRAKEEEVLVARHE
jgi:hypothetical protein